MNLTQHASYSSPVLVMIHDALRRDELSTQRKLAHRGIEANPDKIKAIEEMQPPRRLKDMQRLAGCMASLGRFISKFGERALPFFKIMKRSGPFKWTPEAAKAFEDLKKYLASPPIMVAPTPS